jgi:hypothetical protein
VQISFSSSYSTVKMNQKKIIALVVGWSSSKGGQLNYTRKWKWNETDFFLFSLRIFRELGCVSVICFFIYNKKKISDPDGWINIKRETLQQQFLSSSSV